MVPPSNLASESLKIKAAEDSRWRVDGKFFAAGANRVVAKGVTYGPFAPQDDGTQFGNQDRTKRDFAIIRELGANTLRCYTIPPSWFFDLALEHDLRLFVDLPWNYQLAFLEEPRYASEAIALVRDFCDRFAAHPALFAVCVANEIPPDVVRWTGAGRVGRFLDELIGEVKSHAPSLLATYCGYPSTEYVVAREADFHCYNVYLRQGTAFADYLARLQSISGPKPLVLGELGVDSGGEGEGEQARRLRDQLTLAQQEGVAGRFVYSFSDEWYKDGRLVQGWAFGVTRSDRSRKPCFTAVQEVYLSSAALAEPVLPFVTVVIAAYNAETTIVACLQSLQAMRYSRFEVIVVDDGSQDLTAERAARFDEFRLIRHGQNLGLSVARNTGIGLATGEIVAFTDADCRVDVWWLEYLVRTLRTHGFAGVGGHNLLPLDASQMSAAVGVAPGGPIHVMLTDRVAEHIPGCNMAFYRSILDEVGGFDPRFKVAGDDVDLCWRIQQRGHQIGFCAGSFVWHDRRSSLRAYLKQQMGYGKAEAALAQKYPSLFNGLGDHTWRGRIYDESIWIAGSSGQLIYRGVYGRGLFQLLPFGRSGLWSAVTVSLEFQVLGIGFCFWLGWLDPLFWGMMMLGVVATGWTCGRAASRVVLPRRYRSWRCRALVGLLYALQPVARSLSRYRAQWRFPRPAKTDSVSWRSSGIRLIRSWRGLDRKRQYWIEQGGSRVELLSALCERLRERGWIAVLDDGYQEFDLSLRLGVWGWVDILSAEEFFPGRRRQVRTRVAFRWSRIAALLFGLTLTLPIWLGLIHPLMGFLGIGPLGLFAWVLLRIAGIIDEVCDLIDDAAEAGNMSSTRR